MASVAFNIKNPPQHLHVCMYVLCTATPQDKPLYQCHLYIFLPSLHIQSTHPYSSLKTAHPELCVEHLINMFTYLIARRLPLKTKKFKRVDKLAVTMQIKHCMSCFSLAV
jgi:hypothetical protein